MLRRIWLGPPSYPDLACTPRIWLSGTVSRDARALICGSGPFHARALNQGPRRGPGSHR